MAIPRRFYVLFVVSLFAIVGTYFFLDLRRSSTSWVTSFADGSDEYDENGFRKVPDASKEDGGSGSGSGKWSGSDKSSSVSADARPVRPTPPLSTAKPPVYPPSPAKEPQEISIAVTESGGSHDEVTAALVHAFGRIPKSTVSLYLLLQRYGISQIINSFNLTNPIAGNHSSFELLTTLSTTPAPQILVAATCELDLVRQDEPFTQLLKGGETFLFCVVHHADRWSQGELVDKVKPWVDKQMIHFVTLSAHTAHYFRTQALSKWPYNATVLVNHLPPVFPVKLPEYKAVAEEPLTFALQGDFDPSRRNYTATFDRLESVVEMSKTRGTVNASVTTSHDVQLRLIGHGEQPKVPAALAKQVVFDESLDYMPYYTLLSRTFTVVPAFASPDYMDRKASSSIPASLIAGTPIIASVDMLDAYSYVPLDATWLQRDGESEMDVVERVVGWTDEEHARKKASPKKACARFVERNAELVEGWVKDGMAKVIRAGWSH